MIETAQAIEFVRQAKSGRTSPQPYLVELSEEFVEAMVDSDQANRVRSSCEIAFGSSKAPSQYATWKPGDRVTDGMLPVAAATFVFDAIIQNPDRRPENPNCLVKDDEIRLIDHELAFMHRQILLWRAPWVELGLRHLEQDGKHIFAEHLKNKTIDYDPIRRAWQGLSDARIDEYESGLPLVWKSSIADTRAAIELIKDARDNIEDCITEIRRILE